MRKLPGESWKTAGRHLPVVIAVAVHWLGDLDALVEKRAPRFSYGIIESQIVLVALWFSVGRTVFWLRAFVAAVTVLFWVAWAGRMQPWPSASYDAARNFVVTFVIASLMTNIPRMLGYRCHDVRERFVFAQRRWQVSIAGTMLFTAVAACVLGVCQSLGLFHARVTFPPIWWQRNFVRSVEIAALCATLYAVLLGYRPIAFRFGFTFLMATAVSMEPVAAPMDEFFTIVLTLLAVRLAGYRVGRQSVGDGPQSPAPTDNSSDSLS